MGKKIKVLMLGYHDSKMAGHIQYEYEHLPKNVEGCMVTLTGIYGKTSSNFYQQNTISSKIHHFLRYLWQKVYCLVILRCNPIVDNNHSEYCYFDFDFYPYKTRRILQKCPRGFIPDIIVIYWDRGFVSSRIVRELYWKTKAKIVYRFIDESPMTGGCHYPMECMNYLNGCTNCPALANGKSLSKAQISNKEKNLKNIPLYIAGTPYDLNKAEKTHLFKNAIKLSSVRYPEVIETKKYDARRDFNLGMNAFVVFVAASSLSDIRKGVYFSKTALAICGQRFFDLVVIAAGKDTLEIPGVNVLNLGYVDLKTMFKAYCASDCFVSTTLADSGPMMVNYAMALGVPVVSFAVGIADTLVVHKKTGYLSKYKNIEDVADGIEYIHNLSVSQREQMRKDCKELIKESSKGGSWIDQLLGLES